MDNSRHDLLNPNLLKNKQFYWIELNSMFIRQAVETLEQGLAI